MSKSWFYRLFGFEEAPSALRKAACPLVKTHLSVVPEEGGSGAMLLCSAVNGRSYAVGAFSCPSVGQLREQLQALPESLPSSGGLTYAHIAVDDIFNLHHTAPGALFQVASQFNCLEFPNPHCVPELGVTNYESDRTQGPACALACGAGTVYRNYFVEMENGAVGQTADNQINNLEAFEAAIGNDVHKYFAIENGYTFATSKSLERFNNDHTALDRDLLLRSIRIGLQSDVSVTFKNRRYEEVEGEVLVTQAYVSALSCGYSPVEPARLWEPLARIALDAAYEATILAALLRAGSAARAPVYLSLIGGGVFRNDDRWIADAVARSLWRYRNRALDVRICHFRSVGEAMRDMVDSKYAQLCAEGD